MNDQRDIFAKTMQTTNIWLREIGEDIGADRRQCYHVLLAVLHAVRDRLTVDDNAHFSAQLPMLVRGLYFQNWDPDLELGRWRTREDFLGDVGNELQYIDPEEACDAVFRVLNHYVDPDELDKVRHALPQEIRALWPPNNANPPLSEWLEDYENRPDIRR